jgi:hypothetical protein
MSPVLWGKEASMSKATRSTQKALVGAVIATGLLLAVVAGSLAAPPNMVAARATVPLTPTSVAGPAGPCLSPTGRGPGYNASITNKQDGRTVCITVGEKLLVFLTAPSRHAAGWGAVHVSKPGILKIAPLTLMLPRGVTAVNFLAVHTGVVELMSQRPACTPATPIAATCDAIMLWRVTVVVRA